MVASGGNSFGAHDTLRLGDLALRIARLDALQTRGLTKLARLPFTIRILLECLLRLEDGVVVTAADIEALARWAPGAPSDREVPFVPARVVLQDLTGVPVLVDLAAMRDAAVALGADPTRVNPVVPVDLVVDHSVQVDAFGSSAAFAKNADREYARNRERYAFLRWGQGTFRGYRAVPPDMGIVHQVNLEFLASVVTRATRDGVEWAFPDTVVGTDSHTTMINGLGVLGWGVGGIEAEAAMLGQPMGMRLPAVVGVRLKGALPPGTTATDAVLTITELLRKVGVVDTFVEFFGPALSSLSLADRATIANMAPEYGATCGLFPVDRETLRFLRLTGRTDAQVALVEAYTKVQGLFRSEETPDPEFTKVVEIDLGTVVPCLAGPKRPQDRVPLGKVAEGFRKALTADTASRGFAVKPADVGAQAKVQGATIGHGAVTISAITSCTNTSNPSVMLAAGLLAQKAAARGLRSAPWVKTSLAPGSRVVVDYLRAAGVMGDLETLGYHVVGFGCTTCIGNSGPLPAAVAKAVQSADLVAAAVISGNRNFEGRIHPLVKANYLASPPLVVAYGIAGRVDLDLATQPLGTDPSGQPVYLKDIWPSPAEVSAAVASSVRPESFRARYGTVFDGDERWRALAVPEGERYAWARTSTYIRKPPHFDVAAGVRDLRDARVLAWFGDSVTTDHISPAGDIPADGPAGRYLRAHGVAPEDFNSFGARRGNHEVMVRGTFANVRIRNRLVPGVEGGVTVHHPTGKTMPIFEAAMAYAKQETPLVILAGKEYGTGSSRDWAAKGPLLLGVRAVIAESFERIHRSNLVGMGVLPLEFTDGQTAEGLGLTGTETIAIEGVTKGLAPRQSLTVRATRPGAKAVTFSVRSRVDTRLEVEYLRCGGILPYVLRQLVGAGPGASAPGPKPAPKSRGKAKAPAKAKSRAAAKSKPRPKPAARARGKRK